MIRTDLPWTHPLTAAASLASSEENWVLLYSGQDDRHSYLALFPQETVTGDTFSLLAHKLSGDRHPLENAWFGYCGYELLHDTEILHCESRHYIALPCLHFTRFGLIVHFDHVKHSVTCFREAHIPPPVLTPHVSSPTPPPQIASLASPMTRDAYLDLVIRTREAIMHGDFYQANITRKFTGEFTTPPDMFSLFLRLCEASPAPYSAFMRMGEASIVSSSPECFMTVDTRGKMLSRPIKGTAPRFADTILDKAARTALETSEKDRAENLMIVDLMRNDFARSTVPGSVMTEQLFDISSYATLHHMVSTVTGKKRTDVTTLDAVRQCFPPGSMTGAPKIRAMQWCIAHEGIQRGIYSGALGWFGGDGSCNLSVVIRTLVIQKQHFEFQTGGAIVADSDPMQEWQETLTKARGILAALGLETHRLEIL